MRRRVADTALLTIAAGLGGLLVIAGALTLVFVEQALHPLTAFLALWFAPLPIPMYWVGVARGLVAISASLTALGLFRLQLSSYPLGLARCSVLLLRVGLIGWAAHYWLAILTQLDPPGNGGLSIGLIVWYAAQLAVLAAITASSIASPHKRNLLQHKVSS